MAGVHDLFVENEVLIEDGERVIPELGDRDGGLLRQRVARSATFLWVEK